MLHIPSYICIFRIRLHNLDLFRFSHCFMHAFAKKMSKPHGSALLPNSWHVEPTYWLIGILVGFKVLMCEKMVHPPSARAHSTNYKCVIDDFLLPLLYPTSQIIWWNKLETFIFDFVPCDLWWLRLPSWNVLMPQHQFDVLVYFSASVNHHVLHIRSSTSAHPPYSEDDPNIFWTPLYSLT